MQPIAIVYGSTTSNAKNIAERIAAKITETDVVLFDVADMNVESLKDFSNIIMGSSTWGIGDLPDDWDGFLPKLKRFDLSGKTIALFALGDSYSYSDSFVDSMGIIYEAIKDKGCNIIGSVSTEGYNYDMSTAEIDGVFVGLPLDEDNEYDLSDERIDNWLAQIKPELQ
ncbi:MAG: flavodoxin [Bacteroidales bacterium 36-12]|nr:MAG: flavodoxin [Bacteroidales bacterium 36-12]